MGKKYILEYENSPLGGILDRQLFLATDEWKNKLATIKDVQSLVTTGVTITYPEIIDLTGGA